MKRKLTRTQLRLGVLEAGKPLREGVTGDELDYLLTAPFPRLRKADPGSGKGSKQEKMNRENGK